jgi:peptidoglycan/xylan/chitin deacetylase (PgdA/CDA1 family)
MVIGMADPTTTGLITVTFDDSLLCQFEQAYPILSKLGMTGVVFVPTGLVGDCYEGHRSMNLAHLRELQSVGWEIGSHTVSHARLADKEGRTRLPLPAIDAELRGSRDWLVASGFTASSFAYPNGRYNDDIEAIARRYYRFVRTTENGLNEIAAVHGFARLRAFDLCQRKVDRWRAAVDAACSSKKWLIAMVHGVVESADQIPSGQESFWIVRDDLMESLQYARSTGLGARTIHEMAGSI